MGCNESKQNAVAAGNTVLCKKSSNAVDIEPEQNIQTQEVESVKEPIHEDNMSNNVANSSVQEQEKQERPIESKNLVSEDNVQDEIIVVDDQYHVEKEADESQEIKGGGEKIKDGNGGKNIDGVEVAEESPNGFLSSRKEHEDIEGKPEDNSPDHDDSVKVGSNESVEVEVDDASEEKLQNETEHEIEAVKEENSVEDDKSIEAEVAGSTN